MQVNRILITFFLLITFAVSVHAEETLKNNFYVEEEREMTAAVPDNIQNIIRREQKSVGPSSLKELSFVGEKLKLTDQTSQSTFAVTLSTWDSANAPIWIVQEAAGKTKIIFEYSAGGISVQNTLHNGMRDIAIEGGTAGDAHTVPWIFDGARYVESNHK